MKKNATMRVIPGALAGMVFSGIASAAGFQLIEQSASGIGNAYAGSAAVAENASTIFYNPAGMTQLRAREVSLGLVAIRPSFKLSDGASNPNAGPGASNVLAGTGGDGGAWGAVPDTYLSWALNKDLYVGFGLGAPFGLGTNYDRGWLGGAQSLKFEAKTINLNPSIAYRVNDAVSLGAGINWQRFETEYVRQVGTADYPGLPLSSATARLKLSGDTWGWNAGALFTLSPGTKIGVSYRSTMKYDLTGDIRVSGSADAINAGGSTDAKADLKLPDSFILSGTHQLDDRWELLGDISWTGWSSIPKIDIVRASGAASGQLAQTLHTDYRDTWRVAVGANYRVNDAWKLKLGLAYDQTPVKGADTRQVSLPDNNRMWFSMGGQWKPNRESTLDLGVAYLYIRDSGIHNDQTASNPLTNRGLVDGTYQGSILVIGTQYSMSF